MYSISLVCLLLLLSVFLVSLSQTTEPAVPTQFAIITPTFARAGDFSYVENFIQNFAEMECPVLGDIILHWNNQEKPETTSIFKNKQKWRRKVIIMPTPYNSILWRFRVPQDSKAEVFLSIDDDMRATCECLTKTFAQWQKRAIGSLGPVMSFTGRTYNFDSATGFTYSYSTSAGFFSIGLTSAAFVSRHFLQLYESKMTEVVKMKQIVNEFNNCEDIAIVYISAFLYPQLIPSIVPGEGFTSLQPKVGISNSPDHVKKRSQCLNKFTNIWGHNPLVQIDIKESKNVNKHILPLKKQTILAKRYYVERNILKKDAADIKTPPFVLTNSNQKQSSISLNQKQEIKKIIRKEVQEQIEKQAQNRIRKELQSKIKEQFEKNSKKAAEERIKKEVDEKTKGIVQEMRGSLEWKIRKEVQEQVRSQAEEKFKKQLEPRLESAKQKFQQEMKVKLQQQEQKLVKQSRTRQENNPNQVQQSQHHKDEDLQSLNNASSLVLISSYIGYLSIFLVLLLLFLIFQNSRLHKKIRYLSQSLRVPPNNFTEFSSDHDDFSSSRQ